MASDSLFFSSPIVFRPAERGSTSDTSKVQTRSDLSVEYFRALSSDTTFASREIEAASFMRSLVNDG